jgi:predicted nuclease of predicted toxin-antitoxin system
VPPRFLLDEHVNRTFERVLREEGIEVIQAKDEMGEQTIDEPLLEWCAKNQYVIITNNLKDFKPLHEQRDHQGIFAYSDQGLPNRDPEGLARAVVAVIEQYGTEEFKNEFVDLGEWYDWLHS